MLDYNLANAAGAVIGFEARTPILGFNVPEAVLLGNTGPVALQLGAVQPGEAHVATACSSTWPTRTRVEGHQLGRSRAAPPAAASRTCPTPVSSCRATSAISTRTTRCRTSIGRTGSAAAGCGICPGAALLGGFRLSGFVQMQSGLPYSIFSAEPELGNASQYGDLVRGSGGIYRLGFGRPSLCGSLDELRQAGDDPTEAAFNKSVLCSPRRLRAVSGNQGFGNLGRNVLRGFWQRRVDLSLAKASHSAAPERRTPVGRLQRVQHRQLRASEQRDRRRATDFGKITDSVGGPRVMQLGARLRF